MKPTRNPDELDSLLGRGGVGATRRDAILQSVLARVEAKIPVRMSRGWPLAGLGIAVLAATVLFVIVRRPTPPTSEPFRAKGMAEKIPAAVSSAQIECLGATLDACPTGSLLVVRVAGVRGYVSAWAEPASGGERIWYFSDTDSPPVDAVLTGSAATTRAVRIGPEHIVGSYVVQIRVTLRPMKRDELMNVAESMVLARGRSLLNVISP